MQEPSTQAVPPKWRSVTVPVKVPSNMVAARLWVPQRMQPLLEQDRRGVNLSSGARSPAGARIGAASSVDTSRKCLDLVRKPATVNRMETFRKASAQVGRAAFRRQRLGRRRAAAPRSPTLPASSRAVAGNGTAGMSVRVTGPRVMFSRTPQIDSQ